MERMQQARFWNNRGGLFRVLLVTDRGIHGAQRLLTYWQHETSSRNSEVMELTEAEAAEFIDADTAALIAELEAVNPNGRPYTEKRALMDLVKVNRRAAGLYRLWDFDAGWLDLTRLAWYPESGRWLWVA
jgi:hypothetical protein